MKIRLLAAAIVAVLLTPVLSAAGDVVIIGHPSVPVSTLTKYEVSNIFLGKKSSWSDKTKISFGIQKNTSIHKIFCREYLNKNTSQFANYWKRKLYSGQSLSPHISDGEQEMIKFVSETKGAIGYVSNNTPLDNVKTITIK